MLQEDSLDTPLNTPVAIVMGNTVHDLPDDLYIPPDALEVILETFEGPLDLLLYLIKKQNLDILNIPIAEITKQYITYIELMDVLRLELAAEYLVMAAMLAEIKSRLLLPRQDELEEDEEDPRTELIRRLQEYEIYKQAAENLDELPRNERDTFQVQITAGLVFPNKHLPDVQFEELLGAFQEVVRRADQLSHHQITREPLSVRERMSAILEKINQTDSLLFTNLFAKEEGRQGVIVAFLAILELCKEGIVEILQSDALHELRVRAVTR